MASRVRWCHWPYPGSPIAGGAAQSSLSSFSRKRCEGMPGRVRRSADLHHGSVAQREEAKSSPWPTTPALRAALRARSNEGEKRSMCSHLWRGHLCSDENASTPLCAHALGTPRHRPQAAAGISCGIQSV